MKRNLLSLWEGKPVKHRNVCSQIMKFFGQRVMRMWWRWLKAYLSHTRWDRNRHKKSVWLMKSLYVKNKSETNFSLCVHNKNRVTENLNLQNWNNETSQRIWRTQREWQTQTNSVNVSEMLSGLVTDGGDSMMHRSSRVHPNFHSERFPRSFGEVTQRHF